MTKGLSHTYTCIHSPRDTPSIQAATYHWAEFPVLYWGPSWLSILNIAVLSLLFYYYFHICQCLYQDSDNANTIVFVSIPLGIHSPSFRSKSLQMNDTRFNRMRRSLEPAAQASIPACPPAYLWLRPSPRPLCPAASSTQTIIPFRSMPWIPALCNVHTLPESAPCPCPSLSSKLVLMYQILVSNFSLVRPQLPPALSAHPGCGNFSSVSSLVVLMLPSFRPPHYRTHLLPSSTLTVPWWEGQWFMSLCSPNA